MFELAHAEWQATDCAAIEAWCSVWRKPQPSQDLCTVLSAAEIAAAIELTHRATELLRDIQNDLRIRRERVVVI